MNKMHIAKLQTGETTESMPGLERTMYCGLKFPDEEWHKRWMFGLWVNYVFCKTCVKRYN